MPHNAINYHEPWGWGYTYIDRQIDRQRDRETERQTHTHTSHRQNQFL